MHRGTAGGVDGHGHGLAAVVHGGHLVGKGFVRLGRLERCGGYRGRGEQLVVDVYVVSDECARALACGDVAYVVHA